MEVTTQSAANEIHSVSQCGKAVMAVRDAMYVLGGKWKISILASLTFGKKRYSDVLRDVGGISGKMLSRELKEMEINQLIRRTVESTQPVTVMYELTDYGKTANPVIAVLAQWGSDHRQQIIHREEQTVNHPCTGTET